VKGELTMVDIDAATRYQRELYNLRADVAYLLGVHGPGAGAGDRASAQALIAGLRQASETPGSVSPDALTSGEER
jgi:hypothetical protein